MYSVFVCSVPHVARLPPKNACDDSAAVSPVTTTVPARSSVTSYILNSHSAHLFTARGVALLKGDWTNADPALTDFLAQHGRNGVPLYLYYPSRMGALPIVLPQLLTPGTVLEALGR